MTVRDTNDTPWVESKAYRSDTRFMWALTETIRRSDQTRK
jgi:hypothetical protein